MSYDRQDQPMVCPRCPGMHWRGKDIRCLLCGEPGEPTTYFPSIIHGASWSPPRRDAHA